jgi:glucan phosphoethanolaminetransferase (alkaline phosphatase superfamily)
VAAPETAQSGHALRALALLAVLVSAKAIMLAGHAIPLSAWSPFAYFWQDVCVALVFLAIDRALNRSALGWAGYAVVAAYVALNVPIARVLSTPLTWTMMRAARGPLAGAVQHYVTPANLLALAAPLVLATALPLLLRRRPVRIRRWAVAAGVAFVAAGMIAGARVSTLGLHRNAVGTLVATSLPRVTPVAAEADWRASPFPQPAGTDLTALRGALRGRNVVLVVLESTGSRHLKTYGAAMDPMPNLTALARRAVVVERAYAVYPESIKGLFATLCSRYPAFDTSPELYAGAVCSALPSVLGRAGYRTALFHSGRFEYLGMPAMIERRGFDIMEDAGAIGGQIDSSFGIDDASTVRRMLEWIASLRGQRFFLTYLPIAGHNPYEVTRPGPFRGRDDFTRYLNALHESDEALGMLLDGLRERGLDDETLVIVFGDHGEAFGEHPRNFAHTLFVYEENLRVPYVIAAPGAIDREIRLQRSVSAVDTAPTVLDLLGLPADPLHQGTSLLGPEPRMALFFTDYSIGWLGLADGCWKYSYDLDAGRSHLYDICADPAESQDRAAHVPDRVAAYRDRVRAWAAAQKDLFRRSTAGPTVGR